MTETKFYNKDWQEIERQKCEVYTRVMWYLRCVSMFNTWKKSEFYSRKNFKIDSDRVNNFCRFNKEFNSKYLNTNITDGWN